jgi:hypothetical protein
MATAQLHVSVEQVTLDAVFVAETIARIWDVEERIVAFNGGDSETTPLTHLLGRVGEDVYRAARRLSGPLWDR